MTTNLVISQGSSSLTILGSDNVLAILDNGLGLQIARPTTNLDIAAPSLNVQLSHSLPTEELASQITLSYDNGLLDQVSLPDGTVKTFFYDSDRLSEVLTAGGRSSLQTLAYDQQGQLVSIVKELI